MKTLISQITESGLPVRSSFALAIVCLLVSGTMALNQSDSLLSQLDLAVYGVTGSAAILLTGLLLQKFLESTTR